MDDIIQQVDIVVAQRFTKEHIPSTLDISASHMKNAIIPISSTAIRNAIQEKKSWRYLVHPEVYRYIIEKNLYE